ncbi:hypothetical protein Hypma_002486 [Hypsizygus marmoreus]|uniref:Mid2 domain-containing protein n=1 Tax=Hypsizygus marmoreus TaxID=39966 RepID=A0A369JAU3_HYPMA|nr:hypothetical protein Hypma_002486 [Hypsizygus marmoreus]
MKITVLGLLLLASFTFTLAQNTTPAPAVSVIPLSTLTPGRVIYTFSTITETDTTPTPTSTVLHAAQISLSTTRITLFPHSGTAVSISVATITLHPTPSVPNISNFPTWSIPQPAPGYGSDPNGEEGLQNAANRGAMIGAVLGGLAFVVIIVIGVLFYFRLRSKRRSSSSNASYTTRRTATWKDRLNIGSISGGGTKNNAPAGHKWQDLEGKHPSFPSDTPSPPSPPFSQHVRRWSDSLAEKLPWAKPDSTDGMKDPFVDSAGAMSVRRVGFTHRASDFMPGGAGGVGDQIEMDVNPRREVRGDGGKEMSEVGEGDLDLERAMTHDRPFSPV